MGPRASPRPLIRHVKRNTMSSLYHYTSGTSLLGILQSRQLWATDLRFLNDFEELNKGLSFFEEFIDSLSGDLAKKINKPVEELINILVSNIRRNAALTSINVVSFTSKSDNLRQWMSYCNCKVGYCIEFEGNDILPNHLKEYAGCLQIRKIDYLQDYRTKEYRATVNAFVSEIKRVLTTDSNDSSHEELIADFSYKANEFILNCMFLASSMKSVQFQDESEYRLIYIGNNRDSELDCENDSAELQALYSKPSLPVESYREISDIIVPYQRIPFNIESIKSVVIGPSSNSEFAEKGLIEIRDRNDLCFSIKKSECSLRKL